MNRKELLKILLKGFIVYKKLILVRRTTIGFQAAEFVIDQLDKIGLIITLESRSELSCFGVLASLIKRIEFCQTTIDNSLIRFAGIWIGREIHFGDSPALSRRSSTMRLTARSLRPTCVLISTKVQPSRLRARIRATTAGFPRASDSIKSLA